MTPKGPFASLCHWRCASSRRAAERSDLPACAFFLNAGPESTDLAPLNCLCRFLWGRNEEGRSNAEIGGSGGGAVEEWAFADFRVAPLPAY